jgi:hypothetical protein
MKYKSLEVQVGAAFDCGGSQQSQNLPAALRSVMQEFE